MKVYFLGNGPNYMGCYYVRCFLPMLANGWSGNYIGLSKRKDEKTITKEMLEADVIVMHRANTNWHHRIAMTLKQEGKKIIFDNDDTFLLDNDSTFARLDDKGFEQNKERLNNVVNNFILNADLVTVSTDFLATEYKKLNPKTIVLPNCVNPDDWPDNPLRNEGDKIRIGLTGSTAYSQDFKTIKDLLRKLDNDKRVQLVMFGLHTPKHRRLNPKVNEIHFREYAFWDSLKNLEHIPSCPMADYFDTLEQARLDMMLIPRQDNYFNRCKSNIKYLEASMLEIPVIAQGFKDGPYQELNGENGILVENNWEEEVEQLIANKGKRLLMGATAKQYVLDKYDINKNAQLWVNAYNL